MSDTAATDVRQDEPAPMDEHAAGRHRRTESGRKRRERVARRAALIHRGLLFDEINPDIRIAPEPLGYEATRRYGDQVHKYFETDLELFPDFFGGFLPRDYFRIYRDEIEEKFHTDTLARDLCGQLRHVMNKNFVSLIIAKRVLVLLVAGTVYVAMQFYAGNKDAIAAKPWAAGQALIPEGARDGVAFGLLMAAGLAAFLAVNAFLFITFKFKSSQSCSRVGADLQSILKGIESAYRDALEKVQSDESRGERLKDEWPERAAWWARLILWYPKRIEYIEKTFQISMWRVRYWFAWCYLGGMAALILIAGLIIGLAAWATPVNGWTAATTGAFAAYVLILSACSYYYWRPSLNFVRDQTRVANWDRFSVFRVDDRLAEMLSKDKHKIIDEQRRQRGGGH